MSDEDDHYLSPYLQSALPSLGLDYETYGPYVTGVFPPCDPDEIPNEQPTEDEEEAMNDILELLQQSSETHSEDEDSFMALRQELNKLRFEYVDGLRKRKKEEKEGSKKREVERLKKEIEEAENEKLLLEENKKNPGKNVEKTEEELAKLALIEMYAYDDSHMYDDDGNFVPSSSMETKNKGEESAGGSTNPNRAVASQVSKDTAQNLRKQSGTSKKDARAETKKAKEDKVAKKEERKKRAVKGERKR